MNYLIKEIADHKKEYPTKNYNDFDSLEKYLEIAKRVIKHFGPKMTSSKKVSEMLNSEDHISEVALALMTADWSYDPSKGPTKHFYRNQCGKFAIQDILNLPKTKAHRKNMSLDHPLDDDNGMSLAAITEDTSLNDPKDLFQKFENQEKNKRYVDFLFENSGLTRAERDCITLHYMKGIDSVTEIGQRLSPRITRQAVSQNIKRGLYKMRQSAVGTGKTNKK